MNKIILHIPHSGQKLPNIFWKNICVEKKEVIDFAKQIADLKTDKLFGNNFYKKIIFKYSRVFCDVEKYEDDSKEEMSKFGMGVVYTKTNEKVKFANVTKHYKDLVLNKVYRPYHERLTQATQKLIDKYNQVIMIDCHSFSENIIMFDDKKQNLPDICIGYNTNFNKTLIDTVNKYFTSLGYKTSFNYPYSGTMVPNNLNYNDGNFTSVMLEINKNLYLKNKQSFKKLQDELNLLYNILKTIDLK